MVYKITTFILMLAIQSVGFAQMGQFGFKQLTEEQIETVSTFCLRNNQKIKLVLEKLEIPILNETKNWVFITSSAGYLQSLLKENTIDEFYLEYNPPHLLNDSMRFMHHVDQVHQGIGLSSAYTGKDVIVGFVDTGLDFNHPDFKNPDGSTRVLRIWDHSLSIGGPASPYGYGIVWDSTQINAGTCTSMDVSAHGTTVTGSGVGNGSSVGYNHGVAPDADIIVVKTDFSLPNWTLTIAQACDYIFKVADSLGKPAVINLSLGSYLGSHDGNDPASELMESMLDAQKGRIIVSACGNSGNIGKYHVHDDIDADTSFVWFSNNPSGSLGPNTVYFDLWSDAVNSGFNYSFKAVNPANNYETRGELVFRPALFSLDTPIYDTIWNGANRIATLEIYTSMEGSNYHMEGYISQVDSTAYKYGFYTVGTGSYDLWSGAGLGLNSMVTSLPSVATFPSIVHYNAPDSLQSIVSSWNCSEKVISVGNVRNRTSFANLAGGYYFASDVTPVGKLSPNSSKGPSRHLVVKPDVVATGDVILSAAPLAILTDPAYFPKIDSGGWHLGNGGTSMACPVISGIAALFLERCSEATYQDFINELLATTFGSVFTGTLPNFAYGNGLANAHDLLLGNEFSATLSGPLGICDEAIDLTINSSETLETAFWSNDAQILTLPVTSPGDFYATAFNENGCGTETDTFSIVQYEVPTIDPITVVNEFTELSTIASDSYQWTLNGTDLIGENNSNLLISEPYGIYTCYTVSADGCVTETDALSLVLGVEDLEADAFIVYPNPSAARIQFKSDVTIVSVKAIDVQGKEIVLKKMTDLEYDIIPLSQGNYRLIVETSQGIKQTSIIRM